MCRVGCLVRSVEMRNQNVVASDSCLYCEINRDAQPKCYMVKRLSREISDDLDTQAYKKIVKK